MGRSLEQLIRAGRPASVFCRLARTRFTGVVYVENDAGGGIFSFRDGMPVFVEDLGDAPLLADELLAKAVIDSAQYAEIAARVIELGADDEDIGFCEVAVELGALTQAQVDAELERRLRGRIVQAVGWADCRIEIDGDPEAIANVIQLPQDLGPLIATGVRTFCDEAMVRELLGPLDTLYVRPTVAQTESIQFFELSDEDESVLAELKPDVAVGPTIDAAGGDWLESWQLVLMLVTAEHVEVARAPFAPATERSGLRSSHAITAPSGKYAATSGMREERVRTDSVGRLPAVTGNSTTVPGATAVPANARRPATERNVRNSPASTRSSSNQSSPAFERVRSGNVPSPAPAPAARPAAGRPTSSTTMPAVHPPAAPAATTVSFSGSSAEPRPMPRRDPKRKLSSALQRLERNLKDIRQPAPASSTTTTAAATATGAVTATATATSTPAAATTTQVGTAVPGPTPTPARRLSGGGAVTAPLDSSASRAHVEALLRMRYGKRPESSPQPAAKAADPGKSAADLFRQAQDLMRDNQWPRAHEAMRKVVEMDSANEQYVMYQRWAALRANVLDEEGMAKLRGTLRDKISDDALGKFAYYALGHLALAEKKDEAAEKLFRKALELDKHNKDAERHLRIIELRRKSAQSQANNKIFGIEIGKKKS